MPHKNTWKANSLLRKFSAEVNGEEILKSNFDLHVDPRFREIKYIINDFTGTKTLLIDTTHTRRYASTDNIISEVKGDFKIAIVINKDDHIVLANAYQQEMKNNFFKCEIFKTVDEAQTWAEL